MIASSFLIAVLFWTQLTLGLMAFLMIGHITGGQWTIGFRKIAEPALKTVPLLLFFFLFVLAFMRQIYTWVDNHPSTFFFNHISFIIRSLLYWLIWLFLSFRLQPARNPSKLLCGLGLLALLYTMSFASFDWIMSLNPDWSATGYGVVFIATSLLGSMSLATFLLIYRKEKIPLGDFGNLILMGTLFWIYIQFTQYLILWSAQIPREMTWYHERFSMPLLLILIASLLGSFAIPFPLLLFKKFKLCPPALATLSLVVLVSRGAELFVEVKPAQSSGTTSEIWWSFTTSCFFVAVIGLFWFGWLKRFSKIEAANGQ
jgi:hypothetical protein